MMTNKEIRAVARERLSGNWLKMLLVNIIVCAIIGAGSYFSTVKEAIYITLGMSIISVILVTGQTNLTFNIAKGKEWRAGNFFVGIKEYLRSFGYNILIGLMVVAIEIVFVFLIVSNSVAALIGKPSNLDLAQSIKHMHPENIGLAVGFLLVMVFILILIDLMYSMVIYIILEKNPDIGIIKSMKYSRKLMKKRKAKLFGLYLSFIGWSLLSILTLGIGILFLNSYIMTSMGIFYVELLKDKAELADEVGLVSHNDFVEMNEYRVVDTESLEVIKDEDNENNQEHKEIDKDVEEGSEEGQKNEENQETEKSSDDQDNVSEHKVNQEEKGEV
ncbi:DUF975 family protein [Peptostreptococcus anaerobius]|uniref:DUF975 family protein n=1 Tax=Peptostreptococcus anaerobius TaxID=1261 RepID=UPI00254BF5A8|nr:DUF975 family protein [Peptostreptococcus anaerobius]MDK8277814.1 DUF975 family protein [Peptostreptococcus anaerobius]